MVRQYTASAVARLRQCGYSWNENVPRDEYRGDAARYGTAVHGVLEGRRPGDAAKKHGVDAGQITSHAALIWEATTRALDAHFGPGGWSVIGREVSRGGILSYEGVDRRPAILDEETHTYSFADGHGSTILDTVWGTADLVVQANDGRVAIIDYKTGSTGDFSSPEANPQMQTLGVLFRADVVGIVHAPWGEPARAYLAEIDDYAHDLFRRDLYVACASWRHEYMRPGSECGYCPSKGACSAYLGSDIVAASALVRTAPSELAREDVTMGEMHLFLARYDAIAKQIKERIKAAVLTGAIIERPDGKTLTASTYTKENLSKASILRAFGKEEGEQMLDDLRDAGAIETVEVTDVRAR